MTIAKGPPRWGGAAGPIDNGHLGVAGSINQPPQHCKRNPQAVKEARLSLIREELFGDLDEIRIFAERGLVALDVENDLDLGRSFDQSVKHFLAVAENLRDLIIVKTGAPQ
jgi:hypothetical protein